MTTTNPTSFTPRCGFCGKTMNLSRCSRCKVILYCNREHQAAHRRDHKSACNAVAKQSDIVSGEAEKLLSYPSEVFSNPFETCVGYFWGIFETRDYMRARFALVEALQKVKTRDSVQAQLDHLLDMIRLCRGDNMGVRDLVPALLLRLNKDQECYDFVKWYNTTGQKGNYDWGNMELPFLDVKNADAFESVGYMRRKFVNLSHTVAITLLKIKLMLDLRALQDSAILGKKVPREILDRIQTYVPQSPIVSENKSIMKREDHTAAIDDLTAQVHALYKTVEISNKYFWPSLLRPGKHLTTRPNMFSHGSVEQMQLVLQYSYESWVESPGAIKVIETKFKECSP